MSTTYYLRAYYLLFAHATCYLLLTTHCSLLTTHYPLPTTYYSLLTAYYLLLTKTGSSRPSLEGRGFLYSGCGRLPCRGGTGCRCGVGWGYAGLGGVSWAWLGLAWLGWAGLGWAWL